MIKLESISNSKPIRIGQDRIQSGKIQDKILRGMIVLRQTQETVAIVTTLNVDNRATTTQ